MPSIPQKRLVTYPPVRATTSNPGLVIPGVIKSAQIAAAVASTVSGMRVRTLPNGDLIVKFTLNGTATLGAGLPTETTLVTPSTQTVLARYSPSLQLKWAKVVCTLNTSEFLDIAVLADGAIIVPFSSALPFTISPGAPDELVVTPTAIWFGVVYFDASGVQQGYRYNTVTPPGNFGYFRALASTPDGGFVFAGDAGGVGATITIGPGDPNEAVYAGLGAEDIVIGAYAADRTIRWSRHIANTARNRGRAAYVLANSDAVMAGDFRPVLVFGAGEPNQTNLTGFVNDDMWAARFAGEDGVLAWVKSAGGVNDDEFETVAAAASGNRVVIAGNSIVGTNIVFGEGEPNQTTIDGQGPIACYDANTGELAWATGDGPVPSSGGQVYGISVLPDGSVFAAGRGIGNLQFHTRTATPTIIAPGGPSIYTLQLNPDGSTQAYSVWTPTGGTVITWSDVTLLKDGTAIVFSRFDGTIEIGTGQPGHRTLSSDGISGLLVRMVPMAPS